MSIIDYISGSSNAPLTFSLFDVVLLIGVSQGFFVAGTIWFREYRSPSKILLALLLVIFNALCLKILLHTTGLWQTHAFRYFPLAVELAIQPVIWLYIRSLTQIDFAFKKRDLWHFIPFGLSFGYSVFIYLLALREVDSIAKDVVANRFYFNDVKAVEDYLSIVSGVIYWALGLRLLILFRKWLFNSTSNTDYPTYTWLRNIALLMGLLITLLSVDIVLDSFFAVGKQSFVHWQIFFAYMAGLIYYLGFRGYQLPDRPFHISETNKEIVLTKTANGGVEQPKIELSDERIIKIKEAIVHSMEVKQVFLDPDLSIQKLGAMLQISPAWLSAVVNQELGQNFRNLVNEYRLAHVKKKLGDPANAHLSITGIAYESGFNSEASFFRIFKLAEGKSPKEYITQQLLKK